MTNKQLTLSELEQYLAAAADLLRGGIDQADFKAYIFPLMFFKRLNDVHQEEYALALAQSGGDEEFVLLPENYSFAIPDQASWETVRSTTKDVGQALVTAFRMIEANNPHQLGGIFGSAAWTNKAKLPDERLLDLLEHFSTKTLSNANVAPDVFGQAYEYLIKRFADLSRKKAGEYYTPRSVVRMMVEILDPQPGQTTYDPACGTAGMLIEVIAHAKEQGHDPRLLWGKLYGQEKTLTTASIARMNLLLHGVPEFNIVREDTLRAPAFHAGERLQQFDNAIANPPFSLKNWGREAWEADPWGRNLLGGTPPAGYADWAWIEHMVASVKPGTGKVAVVVPQGALFRGDVHSKSGDNEATIRREFIERDLIEAVIEMAPNLFYGTGLAPAILVLRTRKQHERAGKVLFIDGSELFTKGRNQNTLEREHADRIVQAYQAFNVQGHFAHVASLDEVRAQDYNLTVARYIAKPQSETGTSLEDAIEQLTATWQQVQTSRARLEEELSKWGLGLDGAVMLDELAKEAK